MKKRILKYIMAAICALTAGGSAAQTPAAPAQTAAERADSVQWHFGLVTVAPGREVYQLEGHTALRIRNSAGLDLAINWGVFDFASPNFIYRFVKGETDYMAAAYPFVFFLQEYIMAGRRVEEQELNLTAEQSRRLMELVEENLREENRTYRYNYVKDNCATRPLALVERAAGMPIVLGGEEPEAGTTWRTEMTSYHARYPWYQFGIDLALGAGIDRDITARERTFAPVRLEHELEGAYFMNPQGERVPVIKGTAVLVEGPEEGVQDDATPWPLTPAATGVYLLTATLIISWYDIRRRRITRWFDTMLFGVQFLLGCLLTFLIFVSVHEATSPNWLYLWLNPLSIIPAVGIWIKKCKRAVFWYQICNFAALILLLAAHRYFGQALNVAFPLFMASTMVRSGTEIYMLGGSLPRRG